MQEFIVLILNISQTQWAY